MRFYLGIPTALAALVVLYAPLTADDSAPAKTEEPGFGIAAVYDEPDPPGVISCHGPTLSILVESNRIIAGDSRTNATVVLPGHDWKKLTEWIDARKREAGGEALMRFEIATHAVGRSNVPYRALVQAMATGEASGFEPVIVEPTRLIASLDAEVVLRNGSPDALSPHHGK